MNFFKNKNVLITGHTGFKGSWLSQSLINFGAKVHGFSLQPEKGSLYEKLSLNKSMNSTYGDIRNLNEIYDFMNSVKPEIVFHLAAQALVRDSYEDPIKTYSTNVMGSLNLLKSVDSCESVKSLVYVTSDKCYENYEWPWGYRETDNLGGHDPYSSSKACAEILFSSYSRSFLKDKKSFCASARAGNVIGGGDYSKDRIIPDCIRAAEKSGVVELRNPDSTRPWQHVLEPISGYLSLAKYLYDDKSLHTYSNWNFGPDVQDEMTTKNVADLVIDIIGKGEVKVNHNDQLHEAGLLQLNCDKAKIELGWKPTWGSMESIHKTANWYKLVMDGKCPIEITNRQIGDFFNG